MVNTPEFIERFARILEYYNLSASSFADKVDVQRSSISHLLSGRNKPSLDFVLKVAKTFPEVNLYWLLNGKGSFPSKNEEEQAPTPESVPLNKQPAEPDPENRQKAIDKIVIFYSDGSFRSYTNK
jgi:transcriptional regulator with XRE-family HTH domain